MAKYRIPSDYKNQTPRVTHNWSSGAAGSFHPGLAIPVHHRHLDTGQRIRGRIEDLVQSNPMLGPLMNGFKQVTIATFLPDSAIYGWMRNGKRYTPDQYREFGKVYFTSTGSDFSVYTDPVFSKTRQSRRLKQGLTAATVTEGSGDEQVSLSPYALWTRDELVFTTGSTFELRHIGRGGLWDWLGIPAGAVAPRYQVGSTIQDPGTFKWQLAPFFTYVLSHYYYIANMQEDYMYFTRGYGDIASELKYTQRTSAQVAFNDLFSAFSPNDFIDSLDTIAALTNSGVAVDIASLASNASFKQMAAMLCAGLQAHGGFLAVPYSPDLFGNIIKQGSSPTTEIEVQDSSEGSTGYSIAVPELRLKTKIQNWLDRLFVSGGRWGDVMRTLWGTDSSPYVNKPDFLGVWQSSINPSNVVATANGTADGESANIGQMAARVDRWSNYGNKQGIDYYAKEPGTFMLITMLVPEVAYCQGAHPDLMSISFADDYNPELAGIGFTQVPRWRFSMMPQDFVKYPGAAVSAVSPWFDNGTPTAAIDPNTYSVGEEVAWSWLRTDYPRLHGEFAQNGYYQYWVMPRRFTDYYLDSDAQSGGVDVGGIYTDYSYYGTYVNPLAWQYLFVGQTLADPNFFYYSTYDLRVTSSLPANYMPYLGR